MNTIQVADDKVPAAAAPLHQALFESEQLPYPPVPAHLVGLLQPAGETVLATRPLQESPYDLDHYLIELEANPELPDYAVAGFDGHGISSWAAHYYLHSQGLALFIQLPWGGAYLEPEPARASIAEFFEWAALLQSKMALARQRQAIAGNRWLQVAASQFSHAGWRWIDKGADLSAVPWNPVEGMMADIEQELDELLKSKPTA
jgi:hypothetical protein